MYLSKFEQILKYLMQKCIQCCWNCNLIYDNGFKRTQLTEFLTCINNMI